MATEKPARQNKYPKKKKQNRKPSIRQKTAVEKIVEKIGKGEPIKMGEILKEAGFSENTSDNPVNVTRTQTWQDLVEKYLPEKKMLRIHRELASSTNVRKMRFDPAFPDDEIKKIVAGIEGAKLLLIKRISHKKIPDEVIAQVVVPDRTFRDRALDKFYKIKGVYSETRKLEGDEKWNQILDEAHRWIEEVNQKKDGQ